ncbi:hypothetical protein DFJ58DRAFT_837771 [Suillus subalutaceus]|uniref:uncharacterized protein n=1 Tax=Suillus subalutaceus TaxID=48586 RepID=UPI001B86425D|nr:uncharacterized protein DFJ58DRAFT_837771 [Suillus subalutaceus]KAG1868933.1 hypothetical protein DFJ58DRAFT_837771 [Suillus subalutaceus]
MNVDNTDINMQHLEFQPEDVQTSHDADLFSDDEDNDKDAGDSMDALSQPPTSVLYAEKLKTTLRSNNVLQKKSQWEATPREQEREKQDIHTWQEQQQALLRKNVAEELARHEAMISARKDQEKKSGGGEERPNTGITNDVKQLEEHEKAVFADVETRVSPGSYGPNSRFFTTPSISMQRAF